MGLSVNRQIFCSACPVHVVPLPFQPCSVGSGLHPLSSSSVAWQQLSPCHAVPQAFEVGPFEVDELPKGKFAEGIIGDFVLRNDKVEAVVSGNFHNRRANFKTFRGTNGVNSGDLYDLTLRGTDNDQLTIFAPDHQVGSVSWVRVVKAGTDGEAVIEMVITAAKEQRHLPAPRIPDQGWLAMVCSLPPRFETNARAVTFLQR